MDRKSESEVRTVQLAKLLPADTPRISGIDPLHVRALAECFDELPPILVHRSSMRIVDGMHRLNAARLVHRHEVRVQFFEGDDTQAFLRAISANIEHGLPLSLADRRRAAIRIVEHYPNWSNRAIAKAAGISAATAGKIRDQYATSKSGVVRVGADGRRRPIDASAGRLRAHDLLAANPDTPLRQVAREAGISPGTARDVRMRLEDGRDPLTESQLIDDVLDSKTQPPRHLRAVGTQPTSTDDRIEARSLLRKLREDPALRYTEAGRSLLRWLDKHSIDSRDCMAHNISIPEHCLGLVAHVASSYAREWNNIADVINQRTERSEYSV